MKRISIITMFVLAIILTINAQQRKRTTPVRKPTVTTAKKANTLANIAIVNMGSDVSLEKPLAEGPNALYFIIEIDGKKQGAHRTPTCFRGHHFLTKQTLVGSLW